MAIFLVVGMPGAGKTTWARTQEVALPALRLTPDDWQMAVFEADSPRRWRSRERADHRDRIEGKLIEVGMRAAALGVDVIFDFGLWSRDERSALRWLAHSLGVEAHVVYLPIDHPEQRRRVAHRFRSEPGQFQMSETELKRWHAQFDVPDAEELRGGPVPPPPAGHATWRQWACERWPSLPEH